MVIGLVLIVLLSSNVGIVIMNVLAVVALKTVTGVGNMKSIRVKHIINTTTTPTTVVGLVVLLMM